MAKRFRDDEIDALVGMGLVIGSVLVTGVVAYKLGFSDGKINTINDCNLLMNDIVRDAGNVAVDAYKKSLTENVPSVSEHLTSLLENNTELQEQLDKALNDEFWKNVEGWCILPA